MLHSINNHTTSKLTTIVENSIKRIGSWNVIDKANVVNKVKIRFFTLRTMLVFAKMRQSFSMAPIVYYFHPKYYIWIETDISDHVISTFLGQLIPDCLG